VEIAVPLVHQTDLFRPHQDPDDHWDLLCVYALHQLGAIDARAILIDHPPPHHRGKPDLPGMEMLSAITGVNIPSAMGGARPFGSNSAASEAADLLISILDDSPEPVVINIAGSCRDVAIAGSKRPDLFEQNCKAIILNAGTGYIASDIDDEIEYNVRMDAGAYCSIFELPCRIYWCPCFERLGVGLKVHEHGTRYTFRQGEILDSLHESLQAYFAYMFSRDTNPDWRRWLDARLFGPTIEEQREVIRQMWTTVGLLYASRRLRGGGFIFEPVQVTCRENGTTAWEPSEPESRIWKFRITDQDVYANTMRSALRHLAIGVDVLARS
jgi:hypothetical protein